MLNIKIKFGTTRTVFLVGKLAIKIPVFSEWRLFLQGLLANIQERTFSKTGWPELCPVLFSIPGGWLVIMKRAEPISFEEFSAFNFSEFADKDDYTVPGEDKQDSLGKLDGKVVMVDYGN